jgi:hypothetical protein
LLNACYRAPDGWPARAAIYPVVRGYAYLGMNENGVFESADQRFVQRLSQPHNIASSANTHANGFDHRSGSVAITAPNGLAAFSEPEPVRGSLKANPATHNLNLSVVGFARGAASARLGLPRANGKCYFPSKFPEAATAAS